jgi:hypothetical protein
LGTPEEVSFLLTWQYIWRLHGELPGGVRELA